MNFNFNNQRTKFHLGPPIMRHFSTFGLVTIKPDQNDYNLKQDIGFKNVQHNILQNFSGSVVPNKSFSNPNFVNKENPHILTTKIPGCVNVNFDKQKFVENVSPHLFIQQPKHLNSNNKKIENSVVYHQPTTSDKLSSQCSTQNIVNTSEMPAPIICSDLPAKTMKKKRNNKKNRRNSKVHHRQDFAPVEQPKVTITSKKCKLLCSAPKKFKKEPESKMRHRGKSKKDKPWHKISLDMEIMECDEPNISTPDIEVTSSDNQNYLINKSCPIEILSTNCKNIISEAISLSLSPCADILKNLSTSNTSSSDLSSMSPSSPAIRRLRLPSECDSEDSFIVFCDDSNSCVTEESSGIDGSSDSESDSDFDFDVTDFQEKTDLNKGTTKKKVTFRCDPELCEIHPMVQWGFAYQSARRGPWEQIARDRARFECRIKKTECEISSVLDPCHRDRIFHERFEEL